MFLQTAADVHARNADRDTPANVAAGFGYARCLNTLQVYGGTVEAARSMLLSSRRRMISAPTIDVSLSEELYTRMDRIAAVWERVLDAAAHRADDVASATLSFPRVSSPVHLEYLDDVTVDDAARSKEHLWVRCLDASASRAYYVDHNGGVLWGSELDAIGVVDEADTPSWSLCHDPSGHMYMQNSFLSLSEWVHNGGSDHSDELWQLCWDPAACAPYFVGMFSGLSEWCEDEGVAGWGDELPKGYTPNHWRRRVEPLSGVAYFTHVASDMSVWGSSTSKK